MLLVVPLPCLAFDDNNSHIEWQLCDDELPTMVNSVCNMLGTDRQTHTHTDTQRHAHRHTHTHTDAHTDRQLDRHTHIYIHTEQYWDSLTVYKLRHH